MIITDKKILKNQKFIDLLENASFIWFLQCQQFKTKDLQEFKNKIKNELCRENLESFTINFELIQNKGTIKSIKDFFQYNDKTKQISKNLSLCFQGPTLFCVLSVPSHEEASTISGKEDHFIKGFKIINYLNNNLLIFSLKGLNPIEQESIKKLGVLLQGLFLIKNEQKECLIFPLNLWDYQKLNIYQGKIKNGVIALLSILKTKLILS